MTTNTIYRRASLALAAALALAACSGDTERVEVPVEVPVPTPVPGPVVTVTGDFLVLAGATTQLAATTANGTDASYTWSSGNAAVATVSAGGLVTGVGAGSVVITATGATTAAAGTYNVVVSAQPPDLGAISAKWATSGHAERDAPAFRYWDGTGVVTAACAKCHTSAGYVAYLADPAAAATTQDSSGAGVTCAACHDAKATALTAVTFPSAVEVTGLGAEARCMICHQGRESTVSVDAMIATAAATTDDTISASLSFKNVHYFPAGATQFAGIAKGAYQYAGKVYDVKFAHAPGYSSCNQCHDEHSLALDLESCKTCHTSVTDLASLRNIREKGSTVDYDGDGNRAEGIAAEVEGLRAKLLSAIIAYPANGVKDICYDAATHPYFFEDDNNNGVCDNGEAVSANKYVSFTNKLVRAAYNYQFVTKDPGAFAHNAKYAIQVMFDSIQSLDATAAATLTRDDSGHFQGASEAFRHWDVDGAVPASCAKCHSNSAGFRAFVANGAAPSVAPSNGLDCATCHTALPPTSADPKLVAVASVKFPSTVVVSPDAADGGDKLVAKSFICMTCHSGREAKKTVDDNIATANPADADTVSTAIKFRNVHYAAAGATLLGTEAKVGYEYAGKTYSGRWAHGSRGIDCSDCHDATGHTFHPQLSTCDNCHGALTSLSQIRTGTTDFDGDGLTNEPLAGELETLEADLLAAIQAYASAAPRSAPICYSAGAYPYWFEDTNSNGACDAGETTGYTKLTARLSKAMFNYQLALKDHGAWAHNVKYAAQLLVDSIADLGGDVTGYTRPAP